MRAPGRLLAAATLGLLTLIWGTTWAAIRVSLEGIPPFTGVALRFAIAAACLLPLARLMGVRFVVRSRTEWSLWVVHAVLSFCVSYGVVFWAEQWLPSGLASVLFATFPLLVGVLAHFFLPGERMTALSTVGTVVGFVGIATIYASDLEALGGPKVVVAAMVMIASPVASAVANVIIKRWQNEVHTVSLNAVAMALGAALMAGFAALTERHREVVFDLPSVGALLYLAIAGSAVTFTLYFWLLKHMQARQLALLGYMIPVVALIVGALWLDEPVTLRTVLGSALVVAGVALASHSYGGGLHRGEAEPPPPPNGTAPCASGTSE